MSNGYIKRSTKRIEGYITKEITDNLPQGTNSEITEIIMKHALGAAAAGLGSAWIPGVGGTTSAFIMTGFIWTMYLNINSVLGIKISKAAMKSLAAAVLSNIAQGTLSIVGTIVVTTLLSFTGFGNAISSVVSAALDYAAVIVGGIIYLKLITKLVKAGIDPSEMTGDDLKCKAKEIVKDENIGDMMKEIKDDYTQAVKNGEII